MGSNVRFAGSEFWISTATAAADTITGITAANPPVVTATSHGLTDGTIVYISGVVGMTEVNDRFFIVDDAATNTFELLGIDGSAYTAYGSGGTAVAHTMSKACEVKSINIQGGQTDQIETTSICDTVKTFAAGLSDTGTIAINANMLPQGAVQIKMRSYSEAGTTVPIKIVFPNSATNGAVMIPGYIQQFSFQGAVGQVWAADFSLKAAASATFYIP